MITKEQVKKYCISWLSPSEVAYDDMIEEIIEDVEAYIDDYISYKYATRLYQFNHFTNVINGRIFIEKIPITNIEKIESVNGNELEYNIVSKYTGEVAMCNCACDEEVIVYYTVGGIALEYPRAVQGVAIDLILSRLNHFINNANGFTGTAVGEIKMSYNFELTQAQKDILNGFLE